MRIDCGLRFCPSLDTRRAIWAVETVPASLKTKFLSAGEYGTRVVLRFLAPLPLDLPAAFFRFAMTSFWLVRRAALYSRAQLEAGEPRVLGNQAPAMIRIAAVVTEFAA